MSESALFDYPLRKPCNLPNCAVYSLGAAIAMLDDEANIMEPHRRRQGHNPLRIGADRRYVRLLGTWEGWRRDSHTELRSGLAYRRRGACDIGVRNRGALRKGPERRDDRHSRPGN